MSQTLFKDVRAKNFYNTDLFSCYGYSQIMSYLCKKMQKMGGYRLRFEIKRVENYPNFDTLVLVTRHGLSAFKLKNIKNDSL